MSDVAGETIQIIAKHAANKERPVQLSDRLTDLGVESLDIIEMVMELEEKFDIHIPFNANDTEMKDFQTVGDIVRAIETLVVKKT
jgi:acyl carrier protein